MTAEKYLQILINTGKQASLVEILDAKEARVEKQRQLLEQGGTLISFTLNIPGAVKTGSLFRQAFDEASKQICKQLEWNRCCIIRREESDSPAGYELYVLTNADPYMVKNLMVQIEEDSDFGRLLDIDVLDKNGQKISRTAVGREQRKCFLCGETAAACSRSRKHSWKELMLQIITILQEHFTAQFLDRVAANAAKALLYEVSTTPKPGLVDCHNSGSHGDMDLFTFFDSTVVLTPYFRNFVEKGIELADWQPEQVLPLLRYPGRKAEEAMNQATGGVNCHKGIIFSLGVICTAIGMRYGQGKEWDTEASLRLSGRICHSLLKDFEKLETPHSYGEQLYVQYGITGIRGEASSGYPSVEKIGLPALKKYLGQGMSLNDAGTWTLLELLAATEDTNILTRSDMSTLKAVQCQARELLSSENRSPALLEALDRQFMEKHISPGGCADLLALSYFLYFMEE